MKSLRIDQTRRRIGGGIACAADPACVLGRGACPASWRQCSQLAATCQSSHLLAGRYSG